ncbi:HAMP domain-containing histidine kinase [Actinoallomurus spadix]|uniref:histidine kinase n=1 Tax=Actinoallomurus spadix TaxID=79912 RepID=A0ABP3HEB5_9ACTN|nr:HAMP domain-containing sensor histidine kinase [Actinoallomurus spadix]MCO5985290.1 HAMP domain-containing histidine kinase [Actinoallomurus spadix]
MRSLNARLVAGLLAVTAVGLTLMGLVSAVVLRGYLLHRADNQLEGVRRRPALAHAADTAAPGRYIVLTVTRDGRMRAAAGGPDPARALDRAARVGPGPLFAEGQGGRPFRFGRMRAIARVNARGNLTVIVDPLTEVHAAVAGLLVVESATGVLLLCLVALLGRGLVRRGLAPLSRMAATVHGIASGGDLSARMEESPSEVGRLAGAINVMLGRIEQAFLARLRSEAKVREFAAEASHELRTPLTTIRGYSDLYEQGAVSAEEAMRRISGEAARMGRLVDELLELARLDKGSALSPAPADLAVLARDAVADAAVVEPDRPITLDAPDSLVTVADEARVRQVLANLLANVRAHTPPRTPVTVRLRAADTMVVLEVADEGPGMAPEEAERAFDRFHHARDSDGSGLGLAIVAAIAAAHGGRAALRSAPGAGTVVRVELPRLAPLRDAAGDPPHTGPTGG